MTSHKKNCGFFCVKQIFSKMNKTASLVFLNSNRKRYDLEENSKSREKTRLSFVFVQTFSLVLLLCSLEIGAMMFYSLKVKPSIFLSQLVHWCRCISPFYVVLNG